MVNNTEESYLCDIFQQRNNISSIYHDVEAELLRLKTDLRKLIEGNKINLKPLKASNDKLHQRAAKLKKDALEIEITLTTEIAFEIQECSDEISQATKEFEENTLLLSALDRLLGIQYHLDNASAKMKLKLFYETSLAIQEANKIVVQCDDLPDCLLLNQMKEELTTIREQLLFDMSELWVAGVRFTVDETREERNLSISINSSSIVDVKQIIQGVYTINDDGLMQKFFKKLKERIFSSVIANESAVCVNPSNDQVVLSVNVKKDVKPAYQEVFSNIVRILTFLKENLDLDVETRGNFMGILGSSIGQEVTSLVVKDCLADAVPGQKGNLSKIVEDAANFQRKLEEIGFLPSGGGSFLEESTESSYLFANKVYLSYLDRGRTIMKTDLHNTVKSQPISSPDWSVLPAPVADNVLQTFNIGRKKCLMESLFISKSAQEVLDLVGEVLEETKKSGEDRSIKLLHTIRNIFEMYSAIVPLHHRKMLDSLPQHVAILHNNCLHFAHRLIVLSCECRTFPAYLRSHYHIFLDQAVALRQLAVNSLENCVSNQRSLVIANLLDSGLASMNASPKLDPETERSIRQCIRQLQLLSNIWMEVLSEHVYANTMGYLLDEFTQQIVAMTTAAEDISSQVDAELLKIFAIVEERLPKLFKEPKEVHRLCRKWSRFLELIFVLGNSLEKISERWASGMGPLAHSFTKAEAQGLIRALFRNTERRAAVLSQIYNS